MRIAGNLDVEVTWARMDAAARRARGEKAPSPGDPRFALPEPVMRKISAAATLLRVLARSDDDVLWTPRPVDPSRMAKVEWLPTPRLESGPVPETADVWWGEPTEQAAWFGHRSATLRWRAMAALPLDGAALVRSVDDLAERARAAGPWVAKAPYSASGRLRVRGAGGGLEADAASRARRLLDLFGCLLWEPWLSRTADYGASGELGRFENRWTMSSPHGLDVDARGTFRGIATGRDTPTMPDGEIVDPVFIAAARTANALQTCEFRGAFGIDLFEVAPADGGRRVHLAEVNARRTFGHVGHALAESVMRARGLSRVPPVALRFGKGAPPPDGIPLLLPGAGDDTSAWLDTGPGHGI